MVKLNKYQEEIVNVFLNTTENLNIEARAGCAKTFTLLELSKHVDKYSVFLAFNKSIQQEISKAITNPKFKVYTLNGLGYMILLYNNDKRKLELKQFKSSQIANEYYDTYLRKQRHSNIFQLKMDLASLYDLCRLRYVNLNNADQIEYIIKNYGLFSDCSTHDLIDKVEAMKKFDEINMKMYNEQGIIDFTDQLYITVKLLGEKDNGFEVPGHCQFYNIFVDEAQDLSRIQQVMLLFLKRQGGKYVFVADKFQAIYGFAGADTKSVDTISKLFSTTTLQLPVNYRCGTKHINYINKLYPDIQIQAHENAQSGEIYNVSFKEMVDKAQIGDFIIARKNSELCDIIISLLMNGKPIYIKDKDMIKNIVKTIKKINAFSLRDLYGEILHLQQQSLEKKKENEENGVENTAINSKMDIYDAITVLIDGYKKIAKETQGKETINAFVEYIEKMLNADNSDDAITCTSIHQVKGLEADNVFVYGALPYTFLGRTYDQVQQEINLHYIALSRARNNLYLVESGDII
jgi:superfamily I DNA/RNA helicase